MVTRYVAPARYEGKCSACSEPIVVGTDVVKWKTGWVHLKCLPPNSGTIVRTGPPGELRDIQTGTSFRSRRKSDYKRRSKRL